MAPATVAENRVALEEKPHSIPSVHADVTMRRDVFQEKPAFLDPQFTRSPHYM